MKSGGASPRAKTRRLNLLDRIHGMCYLFSIAGDLSTIQYKAL